MNRNPFISILGGFTVWAFAFLLLYALQTTGCALGWQDITIGPLSLLRAILIASFAAVVIVILALWRRLKVKGRDRRILAQIAFLANAAAAIASFCFLGVLWLSMC